MIATQQLEDIRTQSTGQLQVGAQPARASADELLQILTEASGNPRLAGELLKQRGYSLTTADMIDQVKDHLPELKQRMEVVATLELFSLMPQLKKQLIENLTALEPADSVNAYMRLMDLITKSVVSKDINVNINDQRWRQLPRDVQQVYAALEASGQLQTVIEHQTSDLDD